MGSVMDQERPWERDTKPEGATLRERIKDVLRDKNRLHETVEQIICELERLEAMITPAPQTKSMLGSIDRPKALAPHSEAIGESVIEVRAAERREIIESGLAPFDEDLVPPLIAERGGNAFHNRLRTEARAQASPSRREIGDEAYVERLAEKETPASPETKPIGPTLPLPSWQEQAAFEEWANDSRYEMHQHPLHYLFMDKQTNAARQGWKAALAFVGQLQDETPAPQTNMQPEADFWTTHNNFENGSMCGLGLVSDEGKDCWDFAKQEWVKADVPVFRSPAPQANMNPADFQLLEQLDRDNVAGGARPVIESQGWEQARRLSDDGFIAIESVGLGGRLHITRKGMKAVAAFKRGESAPSPQTSTAVEIEPRSRMQLSPGYLNSFETVISALKNGGKQAQDAGHIAHGACLLHAAVELEAIFAERAEPKQYLIGDRMMEMVFKPSGMTDVSNLQAVFDAVEAALNAPPETHVLLTKKHTGMKVDYSGLLKQARDGLRREPGIAEMLRQLEEHLSELGRRYYDGDPAVVDEFLQLYCIQRVRREALAATTEGGQNNG